jgi:hypothetical protein
LRVFAAAAEPALCVRFLEAFEPIQPMTPKYMTRMEVAINGDSESPKVSAMSEVARICSSPDRKEYALAKVITSRAKPMISTVIPEKATLSLKVLNMEWSASFEY